jgi:hypothetical protein
MKTILDGNPDFTSALDDFRNVKATGFTCAPNGTPVQILGRYDIVTLCSTNIPMDQLSVDTVAAALEPFKELLRTLPGYLPIYFGLFQLNSNTASVDLNVRVSQSFRANTMRFAKANNQAAIWDCQTREVIPTGGSGENSLVTPGNFRVVAELLVDGRHPIFKDGKWLPSEIVDCLNGPMIWVNVDDGSLDPRYLYVNRNSRVLGEVGFCHAGSAFGDCWWKVFDSATATESGATDARSGRLQSLRACRQHVEEIIDGKHVEEIKS